MKLRGPLFFLPLAFFLCTTMISTFRYISTPEFSPTEIIEIKAVVVNYEGGNIEAIGYSGNDTIRYSGAFEPITPGKEITLYSLKRFGLIKTNKQEIEALQSIKQRSGWFALISAVGLVLVFAVLFYTTKKQQNG